MTLVWIFFLTVALTLGLNFIFDAFEDRRRR